MINLRGHGHPACERGVRIETFCCTCHHTLLRVTPRANAGCGLKLTRWHIFLGVGRSPRVRTRGAAMNSLILATINALLETRKVVLLDTMQMSAHQVFWRGYTPAKPPLPKEKNAKNPSQFAIRST